MRRLFDHFEEYILISSLFFSVVLVFMQVIMRYVFKNSLSWSEELARYLFLWQIWLGASYAAKEGRHLRIEMIKNLFQGRARLLFECFSASIWFGFCIFLAWKGTELTHMIFTRGQLSPAMQIPIAYAYASVPVGSAMMALRLLQNVGKMIGNYMRGEAA